MALSGLDIYKLLPKTNCKKCGSPTCLAFAIKLAMKKASLLNALIFQRKQKNPWRNPAGLLLH